MNITVLCKVVDNFGDIGVVYRLCKQLFFVNNKLKINLVVDDLQSFNKICNKVKIDLSFQIVDNLFVYNSNDSDFCYKEFSKNDGEKLSLILECFQCGRPDWMERILFDDTLNRTCNIIMIDYLTAEQYAEDFHCLKSLTRSSKVQKVNFMPGFTSKTGGLILDSEWKKNPIYNKDGPVLIFTYERDWDPLVIALNDSLRNTKIFLARGRGFEPFKESWLKYENRLIDKENCINGSENKLICLDFVNQPEWDKMMKNCSLLFIRGEESMSRACLSGIPFVWHAYPQSDEYQIVKVKAILEKLKNYFTENDFNIIQNIWLDFNLPQKQISQTKFVFDCSQFIKNKLKLQNGFKSFAQDLRKNGDLATNLMTFINKIDIM